MGSVGREYTLPAPNWSPRERVGRHALPEAIVVLAAAPIGSGGGTGPDRVHPTYRKDAAMRVDIQRHEGTAWRTDTAETGMLGNAGFSYGARARSCKTICRTTSEERICLPNSDGTDPAEEGPRIRPWSPVKENLEQTAGKLAEFLTWTEMVGGDGVGVPVHLVARSTRRKFLFQAVLAVDVIGAPTVE